MTNLWIHRSFLFRLVLQVSSKSLFAKILFRKTNSRTQAI